MTKQLQRLVAGYVWEVTKAYLDPPKYLRTWDMTICLKQHVVFWSRGRLCVPDIIPYRHLHHEEVPSLFSAAKVICHCAVDPSMQLESGMKD